MKTNKSKPRALKEKRAAYRTKQNSVVAKQINLSRAQADRLTRLAEIRALGEDEIIAKALDILFSLTDLFDERGEHRGWSLLSEDALQRVWNNDQDAVYDDWRELYGIPAR